MQRLITVLSLLGALGFTAAALGKTWPNRSVTLVSPLPAGASTDVVTRAWMQCASHESRAGQVFVLLNRPGANGVIAAAYMKQQPSDGYTIMVVGMSQTTITPFIFKQQPYNPETDFEGAALYGVATFTLVANRQSGIRTVEDLLQFARTRPDGLDMGIPVIGSPAHVLSAALMERLAIQGTVVPLNSEAMGISALLGDHVPVMIFLTGSAQQHIDDGAFTPLLNFTTQRLPSMPQTPTVVEFFGDDDLAKTAWIGITTKAGSPPEVAQSLDRWTQECMRDPDFIQALESAKFLPWYVNQQGYAAIIQRDTLFWKTWIDRLGISNE